MIGPPELEGRLELVVGYTDESENSPIGVCVDCCGMEAEPPRG